MRNSIQPFLALAIMAITTPALGQDLFCQVKVNTEIASEQKISVPEKTTVTFAEIEGFRLKTTNRGDSKFEIEVYEIAAPSRSYAEGKLKAADDELKWSLWTREILLEVSCRLAGV